MKAKAYSCIRFSTPEQLKGDSLRRQLEASRKYALDNDLELDESLQDLGLSGFHGINRIKGALGRFLQLVKSGRIVRGSYLIVENLDRLRWEDVDEAYYQFRSIIKAGITIITLQDGISYSESSIKSNWAQLIISITYMSRAHDDVSNPHFVHLTGQITRVLYL